MTTKKIFYGLFACAFLVGVSCTTENDELYGNGVEKSKVRITNKQSVEKSKVRINNQQSVEKRKVRKSNKTKLGND
jgi:hypothetical protein